MFNLLKADIINLVKNIRLQKKFRYMKGDRGFMCKYNANQVAEWFLAYNNIKMTENGADPITNLKLQKLLYYAQGTYMAVVKKRLYSDPIMAWKHGPVVEKVYYYYRDYGSSGISYDKDFDFSKFDDETNEILEEVYDMFGQFSAWKLREMTHNETPWQNTEQSKEISPEEIQSYFVENYII